MKFLVGTFSGSGSPHFGWLGDRADTHTLNGHGWRACRDRRILSKIAVNSPAERAQLQVGDIIVRLGERKIDGTSSLNRAVSQEADRNVQVEIYRGARR